jgi:hypothetical protein
MQTGLRLVILVVLPLLGSPGAIEDAEERRMSPTAEKLLLEIASVRAGYATLRLHRAKDGKPGMRCEGICGMPPDSPDREQVLGELSLLRPLADADGSGFVSTLEAEGFHALYRFGKLVPKVLSGGAFSRSRAAWVLEITPKRLDALLKQYEVFPLREETDAMEALLGNRER